MAERAALEMPYARKGIRGSNPLASAASPRTRRCRAPFQNCKQILKFLISVVYISRSLRSTQGKRRAPLM